MSEPHKAEWIDPVNYVRRTVPTSGGVVHLEGFSVRSLIKALQSCDPDDLVVYMAENTPEVRGSDLILGVMSGVLTEGNCGTTFIVGPEAVRALKREGKVI